MVGDHFRSIKDEFERELDALNESARKSCSDNEALKAEICSLKSKVESTTKQRILAEDNARALCKQLEKEKCEQQIEKEEFCKKIQANDGQTSSELSIGYESKQQKLLIDLRNRFKDKICITGFDIIPNLIAQVNSASKWGPSIDSSKGEIEEKIEANIKTICELQARLAECSSKRNNSRLQVDRYKRQHEKNVTKLRCMQQELIALLNQYQDLNDIKLLLDFELDAYNQMLAIEEYRFNVSDKCQNTCPSNVASNAPKRKGSVDCCDAKRCHHAQMC